MGREAAECIMEAARGLEVMGVQCERWELARNNSGREGRKQKRKGKACKGTGISSRSCEQLSR